MLELAQSSDARILVTSTSEIYGDSEVSPQPESYCGNVNSVGPRSCYDEGKRVGESLCWAWKSRYSTDVRIARLFNCYGPSMGRDDGRLIPNLITQSLTGKPITIHGDGSQTRSFCYVSDIVEALISLMGIDTNSSLQVVNIGNPDERTVMSMALKIIEAANSISEIQLKPLPQDDPRRRCPDISLAKKLLNWEPKVSIDVGIARTIEWFRNN